jgi:hypothetical protein
MARPPQGAEEIERRYREWQQRQRELDGLLARPRSKPPPPSEEQKQAIADLERVVASRAPPENVEAALRVLREIDITRAVWEAQAVPAEPTKPQGGRPKKLDAAKVKAELERRRKAGKKTTQSALAKYFGVSTDTIDRILNPKPKNK